MGGGLKAGVAGKYLMSVVNARLKDNEVLGAGNCSE